MTKTVECIKAIRKELKENFKDVKFLIKKADTGAIDIVYSGDLDVQAAKELVKKYKWSWTVKNNEDITVNYRNDIPQVNYIFFSAAA